MCTSNTMRAVPVLVALLLAVSLQPSESTSARCTLTAAGGGVVVGTCAVSNYPGFVAIGGGPSAGTLPGSYISYKIDANKRSIRFMCGSDLDELTISGSVYSDQILDSCAPPLLEIVGCNNSTVSSSTWTGIKRNIDAPGGCTPSEYGPCISVTGVIRQTIEWFFFSTKNTFTSVVVDSSAVTRRGGAISLERKEAPGKMTTKVVGSTFTTVSCGSGGAIQSTDAHLLVRNSTFTTDLAVRGGAINFRSTDFPERLNNIDVIFDKPLVIQKCTFTTGTASDQGGMIAVYRGNFSTADSTFTTGHAKDRMGQCVWLDQCSSYTEHQIQRNTFTACSKTFTTWCRPHDGNVFTSCGIEGPPECSTQFPSR
uniref:Ice-binding protein 6 n=1 Tax=Chloromonas sp. KNF032 TaxID=2596907 RepID=A0A6M2YG55_9CHLO|nr:ice-binding protein 6 [Chloromonas sp. KNF032]